MALFLSYLIQRILVLYSVVFKIKLYFTVFFRIRLLTSYDSNNITYILDLGKVALKVSAKSRCCLT